MENEFLAMDKNFSWLKSHFPSISQANIYFFSLGKKFCLDKKYFVQADGWGIIFEVSTFYLFHELFPATPESQSGTA